jgi:hypothetical protein
MLTLIYSYYDNPDMLAEQHRLWAMWPQDVKDLVEVIITDDCSPRWPATITDVGLRMRLFRITKDIPWNWLECRNIGAHHAYHPWLLLTDMDHVVQSDAVQRIRDGISGGWINHEMFYTFDRVDAPTFQPYKFHPDSYLMTRNFFWQVGGYDEHYAGNYGTSGVWRRSCLSTGEKGHLPNIKLVRYPGDYLPDARTTTLSRKEGRDPDTIKNIKKRLIEAGIVNRLTFAQPYELIMEINP